METEMQFYDWGAPVPDGRLEIRMFHRDRTWKFREMKSWKESDGGITVWPVTDKQGERHLYPWTSIQELQVVTNTTQYMAAFRKYRMEHDHNWSIGVEAHMCTNPFTGEEERHPQIETCEPTKTGEDPGCGLIRYDGVESYDG